MDLAPSPVRGPHTSARAATLTNARVHGEATGQRPGDRQGRRGALDEAAVRTFRHHENAYRGGHGLIWSGGGPGALPLDVDIDGFIRIATSEEVHRTLRTRACSVGGTQRKASAAAKSRTRRIPRGRRRGRPGLSVVRASLQATVRDANRVGLPDEARSPPSGREQSSLEAP
ncbi:hypothetical protein GCM10009760_29130 [Kitasatospora kazusensis]|uniref:Uncharacterized protein n=1 Tax=Kitasatospora kazusensis TaxID=407974 RepID=A0ABP5LA12_9ACTN